MATGTGTVVVVWVDGPGATTTGGVDGVLSVQPARAVINPPSRTVAANTFGQRRARVELVRSILKISMLLSSLGSLEQ